MLCIQIDWNWVLTIVLDIVMVNDISYTRKAFSKICVPFSQFFNRHFFLQKTSDFFRLESTWYTEYKLCTSRLFFLFTPIIQWKIEISFNLMHCYQVNAWLGHLVRVKIDLICGSIGDIACTCVPVNLYLFIKKYIFGQYSSSVYNNAHVIII